jgi:hypothetical protein
MLTALLLAAAAAHAEDVVFKAGFESGEGSPPGDAVLAFSNETTQRVDQTVDTDARFDALWVDFNNDGCYDAFVFDHGDGDGPGSTSRLWVNRCDGSNTFVYTPNTSVHHYIPSPTLPRGSGWMSVLDFNGDGRQDFWLRDASTLAARYLNATPPGVHTPFFADKLEGCDDSCEFGDISGAGALEIIRTSRRVESMADGHEIYPASGPSGRSIIGDVTGNTWQDIIQPENHGYWHNDAGTLTWHSVPALKGNKSLLALADFDNDGAMDLVSFEGDDDTGVGHAYLFRNNGSGDFTDVTAGSGIDQVPYVGWWTSYGNVVAADFDNDGLVDLMMAGPGMDPSVTLLRNRGNLHFEPVSLPFGTAYNDAGVGKSRAAVADFDNDGRLDIVKTQSGTNLGIWRNVTNSNGHWMKVRVRGPGLNSDGVGADLTWFRPSTGQRIAHMSVQVGNQHPQTWIHTGLGDNDTADLLVRFPDGGPQFRFDNLAADQEVIVYSNGCLIQHWLPGNGWPLKPPADCKTRGTPPGAHSRHASSRAKRSPCATPQASALPSAQRIELHRTGAVGDDVAVTVGVPFAPGALTDAKHVRIVDAKGNEIPAHVTPTLTWHFKDGSIRAVRAQFRTHLDHDRATVYFLTDAPRTSEIPGWPYDEGLVANADAVRVPGVLATLDPGWMSASLIAGPQEPVTRPQAYDRFFARQFEWARKLPIENATAWLFDRPSTLYKQYVRTGRLDYLQAAVESYRFYMAQIVRAPSLLHPTCVGGWAYRNVNPCDVKFVYIEPILLALALGGDDSLHDSALVRHMADLWDDGGWSGIAGPYKKTDQIYTERHTGLGLLAIVSAYELTGDRHYLEDIGKRIGWLYDHQTKNPDDKPADGSWRHSWQRHEGDDYDADTDVRGASPWMSENIIDGLWHAWLVTSDARIPPMITAFGRYLERYGWIDPATIAGVGKDWRHECSGPDGQIAWYWSSSLAPIEKLVAIENNDGWYSDEHTVELGFVVAAARYFETDAVQKRALDRRLALIANSYAEDCAANGKTARSFNWNNRSAGATQWLVKHAAPDSAPPQASGGGPVQP